MKMKGIRIFEPLNLKLSEILKEISEKKPIYFSVLFLDGLPNPEQGKILNEHKNKINNSENGLVIDPIELIRLSFKCAQIYEILIFGSNNIKDLKRYKSKEEMQKACDLIIELVDCAFWEIYTKEISLILKFKEKFPLSELIE